MSVMHVKFYWYALSKKYFQVTLFVILAVHCTVMYSMSLSHPLTSELLSSIQLSVVQTSEIIAKAHLWPAIYLFPFQVLN